MNPIVMNPVDEIGAVLTAWAKYFLVNIDPKNDDNLGSWSDARNEDIPGTNSILDSEILLTFLIADSQVPEFRFDCSSHGGFENLKQHSLYKHFYKAKTDERTFSYWNDRIKSSLHSYFTRNKNEDGTPTYTSDSYLGLKEQDLATKEGVETVDSYSFSLTVSLYTKLLSERLKSNFSDDEKETAFWTDISALASERITGALRGLISSFSVSPIKQDTWEAKTGRKWPGIDGGVRSVERITNVRNELRALGKPIPAKLAFELGWSWGPLRPKHICSTDKNTLQKAKRFSFYSENAPYMYFTINALDGIADLTSPEVESGGVLDPDQLALASLLKSLAAMTSNYWMALATADQTNGPGEWEIETLPWRTADGQGSLYWNLYLARLVLSFGSLSEPELSRFTTLSERLAEAARITTPPFPEESDQAVSAIHYPGLKMDLYVDHGGEEGVAAFDWVSFDFSAQLLKLTAQISSRSLDANTRERLLTLTRKVWEHLTHRTGGGVGRSWDIFENAFEHYNFFGKEGGGDIESKRKSVGLPQTSEKVNSWYMTERVMEALVIVAQSERQKPRPSLELQRIALSLAQEAQWHISKADGDEEDIIAAREKLDQYRKMVSDQPGLALSGLMSLIQTHGKGR